MSDRDTHFAEFGMLLWREIEQAKKDAAHERDPFVVVGFERHMHTLLARRAYDLACHCTHELDRLRAFDHGYRDEVGSSPEQMIQGIPDMTTLPKEVGTHDTC